MAKNLLDDLPGVERRKECAPLSIKKKAYLFVKIEGGILAKKPTWRLTRGEKKKNGSKNGKKTYLTTNQGWKEKKKS